MTISRGSDYGTELEELPANTTPIGSDQDLAQLLASGSGAQALLTGGDLWASLGGGSLGGRSLDRVSTRPHRFAVDLGWCELDDGSRHPFAAHVVARRALWQGSFAVVMNATHLRDWNLGPRAHPNDGLLDLTWGRLDFRQRLLARRRVVAGTHVPHPGLETLRTTATTRDLGRSCRVWIDSVCVGRSQTITLSVQPDAGSVILAAATST